MIKALKSKKGFLIFLIAFFSISGNTVFAWTESPSNPIYDPVISAEKAYYPSVIKMSNTDYRMWYQTNSTAGNTTVGYATSADGLSWTMVTNQVSGLISGNAGHPFVKLVDSKFEIWYWNAVTPYGNTAMHHAESVDGITWVNDIAITGNLTTVASGLWNSGTYGAIDVIINNSPTNTGTNPFDYKYAMYYDATSGGYEQVALGYSSDGVAWTLYGTGPVLSKGGAGTWDSGYVGAGSTIIKGNFWTMWYSGGVSASSEGIGCATSVDGLEWVKCPNNPIMSATDGVTWRNSRTYTPKVIRDGSVYKMWFTGRDTAVGNYTIGYATRAISTSTDNLYIREVSAGNIGLPAGITSLVLDENEILNAATSVSSASAGTITIAGSPIALSSFTSGDLNGVDLSTPKNIGGKSILVEKAVKVSSGVSGAPIRFVNPNISTVIVSVPDATVILASSGWDGTVTTPRTAVTSGDTTPSGFSIGIAFDIGSSAEVLLFDKPVQVALSGITGSVGYRPSGSTIWTRITSTCAGTYGAPTLSSASFPGECSITNGTDTKILTYHFATFGGLTPASGGDFETFSLGDLQNQDGWTSGHGSSVCPLYDVAVVSNSYGYSSFGSKSLRISNAITCGSFSDQTFSKSLANEAGETSASTSTYSGGTRQQYFEAQWDFASAEPGSEQPGLSVVASADRGDPARMTWLQMQDTPSGLQLNFEDYHHAIMDFVFTPIATALDRTVPHTVKMTIQFVDGPGNDVVKVYLDGTLIHTGTTWEDYFRDWESGIPAPVDSIMFRVAGTAAPANSGKGFLIDNFSSQSGLVPILPPATATPDVGASKPTTIIFSGKAFPGGTISVIDKQLNTETFLGKDYTTAADGTFNIPFVGIMQTLHSFGLIAKDKEGRISQTKFFFVDTRSDSFTEKDILLSPTIGVVSGQVSRGGTATIFGYAFPQNSVHLYIDDILTKETTVGKDGSYEFDIPTGALDFGQHTVKTKQSDITQKKESDFSTIRSFLVSHLTVVKADINGDGKVDIKDWSIFLSEWGSKDSHVHTAIDLNGDGKVDIVDFSIFIKTIRKK